MKTHAIIKNVTCGKSSAGGMVLLSVAGMASFLALGTSDLAAAQSRYSVTDVGTLPGLADSYLWEQVVNNMGHVAAYANNAANPNAFAGDASFLWKGPGQVELLPGLPGATDTIAFGMNDLDQVVGDSGAFALSVAHGVLWENGVVLDLGTLPGDIGSDAYLINNKGVAVGDSYNASLTAVFWDKSRAIHALSSLPGTSFSGAYGINDQGTIVGFSGNRAVMWRGNQPTDLGG